MINGGQRRLLSQYLLLDLAVKSLQHDMTVAERFKMKRVFLSSMDALLKQLHKDYFQLKRQLAQQKIRLVSWHRIDDYFSDVQVATVGNDEELRYANQALKTQVEELLLKQLQSHSFEQSK
ncbi:aconitate hydratase [Lysinibacillus cavernae]|uniref:aconitate hydratase n=1 Tax=Lysinibacillus cavernae TaxID=2666135 RepID=UPI0012D8CB2E|nr:aconitate hydratase [Lysinibacillus cavernae]